jgi:hypothetical protein
MDLSKMISELRAEQDLVEQAILSLEHLAFGSGKRRGRPPKWMTEISSQKKRTVSPEARKRMAHAQRKRRAAERRSN